MPATSIVLPQTPFRPAHHAGPLTLRKTISLHPSRPSSGMTLLELIVVIVILGILAAIAIPVFLAVIQKSQDALAINTLEEFSHQAYIDASANQVVGYDNPSIDTSAASTNITAQALTASAAQSKTSLYIPPPTTDSPPQPGVSYKYGVVSAGFVNSGATLTDPSTITASLTPAPALYTAMKSTSGHCVKLITQAGNVIGSQVTTTGACQSVGTAALTTGTPPPGDTSTTPPTTLGSTTQVGFSGTSGDAQVTLSWNAISAATAYTIACAQNGPPLSGVSSVADVGVVGAVTPSGSTTSGPSSAVSATFPNGSAGSVTAGSSTTPGSTITARVGNLQNFVEADCIIQATGPSSFSQAALATPPTAGYPTTVVPLTPTATLTGTTPSTCTEMPSIPAGVTCSYVDELPPGSSGMPVTVSGSAPLPTSTAFAGTASITSPANEFPHLPYLLDPSQGAIYQAQITSDGVGSARVMFPAGSFNNPQAIIGGPFATGGTALASNVLYVADASNGGSIWRVDPNSYLVNGSAYTPPTKLLVASGIQGIHGLTGFACYSSSGSTPDGPVSGVAQLCLYAAGQYGIYRVNLNTGAVAELAGSGGALGLTFDGNTLVTAAGRYMSGYDAHNGGAVSGYGAVDVGYGTEVTSVATTALSLGGVWKDDGRLRGNGTSTISEPHAVLYTDDINNSVGAADQGDSSVTIAGGGTTQVNTRFWTSCANAYFTDPTAAHFHGPQGLIFVSESGNNQLDMIETADYVSPAGSSDPHVTGTCRVKAVLGPPDYTGETWAQSASYLNFSNDYGTNSLNAVSCWSDSYCVAVGAAQQGGDQIIRSSDGGVTWSNATTIPPKGNTAFNLYGVSCVQTGTGPHGANCVAVGTGTDTVGDQLAYSTDGGDNWTLGGVGADAPGYWLQSVSCSSALDCVAVGFTQGPAPTYTHGDQLVYTTNGGSSWTQAELPPAGSDSSYVLSGISCSLGTSDCVAVGYTSGPYSGQVLVSSGAGGFGQGWSVPSGMSSTLTYYSTVSCVAGFHCVAGGGGGTAMAYTADGVNWSDSATDMSFENIYAVSCQSDQVCVLVGNRGEAAFYTADGGAHWSAAPAQPFGYYPTFYGVSCPSSNVCVTVGNDRFGNQIFLSP
jgi:prepilin-type N-terminal cleavage/methylation domain-containing protein